MFLRKNIILPFKITSGWNIANKLSNLMHIPQCEFSVWINCEIFWNFFFLMKTGIFPFGYMRWAFIFSKLIVLHFSVLNSFPLNCTLLSSFSPPNLSVAGCFFVCFFSLPTCLLCCSSSSCVYHVFNQYTIHFIFQIVREDTRLYNSQY